MIKVRRMHISVANKRHHWVQPGNSSRMPRAPVFPTWSLVSIGLAYLKSVSFQGQTLIAATARPSHTLHYLKKVLFNQHAWRSTVWWHYTIPTQYSSIFLSLLAFKCCKLCKMYSNSLNSRLYRGYKGLLLSAMSCSFIWGHLLPNLNLISHSITLKCWH